MMWRVTVLSDDGRWADVDVEAGSMGEAVDSVIDRDGVANVIECLPQGFGEPGGPSVDGTGRGGRPMSRPLFSVGDAVAFDIGGRELDGTVAVVDYRGRTRSSFKGCDWSYDILSGGYHGPGGSPVLCKHISECDVRRGRTGTGSG